MRVIASVQSKRGSSRGLVHYIAHSKIDSEKEAESGRELFNAFTDKLDLKNANNFLKADCGNGRPSNDELHHLVLSFKPEDFQRLGSSDKERARRLKAVTRSALNQLEKHLSSEKLAWAGAVHLNTANPHVHIAISKHYQTRDIQGRVLKKVPRDALPHFEISNGKKQMVNGFLIETAKAKLEELIAIQSRSNEVSKGSYESRNKETSGNGFSQSLAEDRDVLRAAILAEYQLRIKEERIAHLIENRDKLRFPINTPQTGAKIRLSLNDLSQRSGHAEGLDESVEARQIKAITLNILAKEESEFFTLKEQSVDVRHRADKLRKAYKKSGTKLPLPAFTKREIDDLQDQCLNASKVREFLYLESVRNDLEDKQEIAQRDTKDLERLAAQKFVSEQRLRSQERALSDFEARSFYRKVLVGNERLSLAMIDRDSNKMNRKDGSILETIRKAFDSLNGRETRRQSKSNSIVLSEAVNTHLNEISTGLHKNLQTTRKVFGAVTKVLGRNSSGAVTRVLGRNSSESDTKPALSSTEILEVDSLSRRNKQANSYAENWVLQKSLIGQGAKDANEIIAGRVLARDILCAIEVNKAKEDLEYYRRTKRFHKFRLDNKMDGSASYLSLNDIDLPQNKSVLDQALNLLLDSRDHRQIRREVEGKVKEHERTLKTDLASAKEMSIESKKEAAEFLHSTWRMSSTKPLKVPIFTGKETTEIERRMAAKPGTHEALKLKQVLDQSRNRNRDPYERLLDAALTPEIEISTKQEYVIPTKRESKDLSVEMER